MARRFTEKGSILRIWGALLLFFAVACNRVTPNQSFYFPVDSLFNEKKYYYADTANPGNIVITYFKSFVNSKDTFLRYMYFMADTTTVDDSIIDRVSNGDAKLYSYTICYTDSIGKRLRSTARIIDSMVFKEDQKINESIHWKIRYKNLFSNDSAEESKSRKLIYADDTMRVFCDECKYKESENGYSSHYTMTVYFKKGKGYVKYEFHNSDGTHSENYLQKIVPVPYY